jgi:hypothetical protein
MRQVRGFDALEAVLERGAAIRNVTALSGIGGISSFDAPKAVADEPSARFQRSLLPVRVA